MSTPHPFVASVRRAVRRPAAVALVLLLAVGAAGAACSSSDTSTSASSTSSTSSTDANPTSTTPLSDANDVQRFDDPSGTISVSVGQTFQLAFPADAGACYSWDLTTPTSDTTPVSLVTSRPSEIVNTDDSPALTGESDTDIYELTAVAAGSIDLEFTQISPCTPDQTGGTRALTVVVND